MSARFAGLLVDMGGAARGDEPLLVFWTWARVFAEVGVSAFSAFKPPQPCWIYRRLEQKFVTALPAYVTVCKYDEMH